MSGFTLIELMVVVAIVAILASIATASYRNSVIKTRRANATACLVEAAQIFEREYTRELSYDGIDALPEMQCRNELDEFYEIGVQVSTATTYTLFAQPDGTRQKDEKCGRLTLNQAGEKTYVGTAGSVDDCW